MAVRVTAVLPTNEQLNYKIIQNVTIYVTVYEINNLITRMAANERADLKQG